MTRILLACGIGASTGFMAANMRKAAKAQGLDVSIHAVSKSQVPASMMLWLRMVTSPPE